MSEYLQRAMELRADKSVHYNCAQSVIIPFAARCGITEEQANRLGTHFGSGMKMASTCGAITGALMVIGLLGGGDKEYRAFMELERQHHGKLDCASLLKANQEQGGEKKSHCDGMVLEAVELVTQVMGL